jgi:hypothetical protein
VNGIPAGLENKLERLMASKGSSFEKEVAYRASQAAGAYATCAAIYGYYMHPASCL